MRSTITIPALQSSVPHSESATHFPRALTVAQSLASSIWRWILVDERRVSLR